MDAISFVASVAQLAGAGLTISKALYEYASRVSSAPKKLNDLARDVQLTSSVLRHLSEVFAEATVRAFVRPGALHTAKDAIDGCSEIFAEMESLIRDGKGGFGKFILPFKESKIQLLNARLASLKSTLQLLLQVLQYASSANM
jgi:STAND-like protein